MSRYFLIGEMHGTKECPEAFFAIVKKNRIKNVALELPKNYQKEIREFFRGERNVGELSFFEDKEKKHDGRASESIKNLILRLKKEGINIFLVDEEAQNGNERDKLMAKNLSKIRGDVAFLCGDIHARKNSLQLEKSDKMYKYYPHGEVKTCGSLMSGKDIVSIRIHAINGGKFYHYSIQTYPKDGELSKKFSISELPRMIKSDGRALDYVYLIDKFSYSK